jgi:hypothetical protein
MAHLTTVVENTVNTLRPKVTQDQKERAASNAYRDGHRDVNQGDAVNGMPTTRATDRGYTMTVEEITSLKNDMTRLAPQHAEAIAGWDGSTIEFTEEQRPVWEALAAVEALQYNQAIAAGTESGFAGDEAKRLHSMLVDSNNGANEFAVRVITQLSDGYNGAFNQMRLHSDTPLGVRAAMNYVSASVRFGMPNLDKFAADADERGLANVDTMQIAQNAKAVVEVGGTKTWFSKQSTADVQIPTTVEMGAAFQDLWNKRGATGDIEDDFKRSGEARAAMEQALGSGRSDMEFIKDMWMSFKVIHSGLDNTQIASLVDSYLTEEGFRWRHVNGSMRLIVDPWEYTGSDGDDLNRNVANMATMELSTIGLEVIDEGFGIKLWRGATLEDFHQRLYKLDSKEKREGFRMVQAPPLEGVKDIMLKRPDRGGGYPYQVLDAQGTQLGHPALRNSVTLQMSDGTTHTIPAGSPLAVNQLFFSPNTGVYKTAHIAERWEAGRMSSVGGLGQRRD